MTMTRPCWLGRAARNRHRHAIEQASRRWRGGRRGDSGRTRRKILISTQVQKAAGNPKVMAAVQDVMQNGPGAMKKYENDREVKAILDELKGIL